MTQARFDSADRDEIRLGEGAQIRFGGAGIVGAAAATMGFSDPFWHHSRAGQAADAALPAREPRDHGSRPVGGWLLGRPDPPRRRCTGR